ncbi:MAG: methyltransferase domain-containing protein [Candidatus Levybacteria bacterium]|nr:methyltransferase domain-containing protein [Candidatus Levybacteria bacterium]
MRKIKALDIGCGLSKIPNADGMDVLPLPTVQIVHDANKFPYPIKTNTYDKIYCYHILEHVDDLIKVMNEIYRIGKNNCKVYIRGPHCSCNSTVWIDPTHKRGLSIRMFTDYFSQDSKWSFYTTSNFALDEIKLNYVTTDNNSRIPRLISTTLTYIANLNRTSQELCERLWSYWFGGFEEIEVKLTVKKQQKDLGFKKR